MVWRAAKDTMSFHRKQAEPSTTVDGLKRWNRGGMRYMYHVKAGPEMGSHGVRARDCRLVDHCGGGYVIVVVSKRSWTARRRRQTRGGVCHNYLFSRPLHTCRCYLSS